MIIPDVTLRTVPVGLSTFISGDVYGWGFLMAGAVLVLPQDRAYLGGSGQATRWPPCPLGATWIGKPCTPR